MANMLKDGIQEGEREMRGGTRPTCIWSREYASAEGWVEVQVQKGNYRRG